MLFTPTALRWREHAGASIATLRITDYGTGSSSDGSKEYFFGDLMITAPGLPGDYNNNGSVDTADYVVWRKGGPLQNDATTGVQPEDYDVWRRNFGQTCGSGSGASVNAAVPEPTTLALLMFCGGWLR